MQTLDPNIIIIYKCNLLLSSSTPKREEREERKKIVLYIVSRAE